MDRSALRRGQPAAHLRLADWHRAQGLGGSSGHFGESAAVLLADLCLVWAEQLFRDSGLPPAVLARGWPRYDTLRGELAVGQFADLVNDARGDPTLDEVLEVTRRKSGNYTVRRPLELGAALAGAGEPVLAVLGRYGELVGEAFQLRDDVLGVFGDPGVTGKPAGEDIREGKQTLLLVLARQMAGPAGQRVIETVPGNPAATDADIAGVRTALAGCGALDAVERRIAGLVRQARAALEADVGVPADARGALLQLAGQATRRGR
jgi:geranylgeranyl diphosphate synthase type I